MKLATIIDPIDDKPRLARVDRNEVILLEDLPRDMRQLLRLGDTALARAAEAKGRSHTLDDIAFAPVVHDPANLMPLALNFQSHIDECKPLGLDFVRRPDFPILSPKMSSSLHAHGAPVAYPPQGTQLDYEIELAFVVGRECRNVEAADWRRVIAGFTIAVDLTLRDLAFAPMRLFEGKNFDGALPLGPWMVTTDEIADPRALELILRVNGAVRQQETMANAYFGPGDVIAYWSQRMTLQPGDVFTLGTPGGIGYFQPDREAGLLHPGDLVEAEVSGIGTLSFPIANRVQDVAMPTRITP